MIARCEASTQRTDERCVVFELEKRLDGEWWGHSLQMSKGCYLVCVSPRVRMRTTGEKHQRIGFVIKDESYILISTLTDIL